MKFIKKGLLLHLIKNLRLSKQYLNYLFSSFLFVVRVPNED